MGWEMWMLCCTVLPLGTVHTSVGIEHDVLYCLPVGTLHTSGHFFIPLNTAHTSGHCSYLWALVHTSVRMVRTSLNSLVVLMSRVFRSSTTVLECSDECFVLAPPAGRVPSACASRRA